MFFGLLPDLDVTVTGGLHAGVLATTAEDIVDDGVAYGLNLGVAMEHWDVELGYERSGGFTRGYPYPAFATYPSLSALYHPDSGATVDPFAGAGIGWRHVAVYDELGLSQSAADRLGLHTQPVMDLSLSAVAGATIQLWGPVHLRGDVRAWLVGGGQAYNGSQLHGSFAAVLGLDLRDEGPPDEDRDGVADAQDRCPDSLEDHDRFDDKDGCLDPDDDRDGAPDVLDRCKEAPEDRDGFQDEDGCPDPNNDEDEVSDVADKCPLDAETDNSFEDSDGCPEAYPAVVQAVVGILPGVAFDGAALLPSSDEALGRLAAAMRAYPAISIRVMAYWSDGSDDVTLTALTLRQAEAVRAWLVAQGIAAERVAAEGRGMPGTMGENLATAQRLANRRIVIELTGTGG